MRFGIVLLYLLALAPACWAECEPAGAGDLIEGEPVVKVSPIYPKRAMKKGIEGCVTLGYGLVDRNPSQPGALVATNVVVLGSSDNRRAAFERSAKKAIGKWLFLAKTHPASKELAYYSVVAFELSEED